MRYGSATEKVTALTRFQSALFTFRSPQLNRASVFRGRARRCGAEPFGRPEPFAGRLVDPRLDVEPDRPRQRDLQPEAGRSGGAGILKFDAERGPAFFFAFPRNGVPDGGICAGDELAFQSGAREGAAVAELFSPDLRAGKERKDIPEPPPPQTRRCRQE